MARVCEALPQGSVQRYSHITFYVETSGVMDLIYAAVTIIDWLSWSKLCCTSDLKISGLEQKLAAGMPNFALNQNVEV